MRLTPCPCGRYHRSDYMTGWERDANGLPIGYYVTVRDAGRAGFLLGPYRRHREALADVDRGAELARAADPRAAFYAFGTARAPERRAVFGRPADGAVAELEALE